MAQDIFIGVDGGGTKSKIRVEDSEGLLLGQAVNGPANVRLSVERSWESILTALSEVLAPLDMALPDPRFRFHAAFGLAGCEMKEKAEAFLEAPHPFTTLQLTSDAHIACLGAHLGQDGAIIIVGTGVVGYQIQKNKASKVGGWGFPQDDEGGGAWLGLEAARLTFQWLDHRAECSPLAQDVFAFFNQDLEQFVRWANHANSSEFARLAPLVINHAQQEDLVAVRLMKKAAHAIDRISLGLMRMNESASLLPCVLFGGIAPFVEPWLSEHLRAHLVPRQGDANTGAILMARKKAGGHP